MVGFDPEGEPEEVAEEMRDISSSLRSADVTRAVATLVLMAAK
jgi:hypothetical protein